MNTRKLGKMFCEIYNEEHGTNLSPKEIFTNVIIPVVFTPDNRHLMNITNSKFFYYANDYTKGKKCKEDFPLVVEEFCKEVESERGGLMDTLKIYGGCAVPYNAQNPKKYIPTNETTMFCYNENIYYSIDERYHAWIGAMFVLNCNGYNIIVNDRNFVKVMWESINAYRNFLDSNEDVEARQIQMWNEIYLCQKYSTDPNGIYDIRNNFVNKGRLSCKFDFSNILFIIAKHFPNVKYIEAQNIGQTNVTCGAITLDLPNIRRQADILRHVYENIGEDFNKFDYNAIFGKNLLYRAIETGSVSKDLINPISEWLNRREKESKFAKKFNKEYIEFIMNAETKDLVKKLAQVIMEESKALKNNLNKNVLETLKSSRTKDGFIVAISDVKSALKSDNDIFDSVVDYIVSDACGQDSFKLFIAYLNYNLVK